MIFPAGLITRPFMPDICMVWNQEPRALEVIMMETGPDGSRACGTASFTLDITPRHTSTTRS